MGKGDDPNCTLTASVAMSADDDALVGAVETLEVADATQTLHPITDPDALKALAEEDPELAQQLRNRRMMLPFEATLQAAEITAQELDIDYALAVRVEQEEFPVAFDEDGNPQERFLTYEPHREYLNPGRELIRPAEETMPGATEAAKALLAHIRSGEKIAVFADYDPDGTCSGEMIRMAFDRVGVSEDQQLWRYANVADGFGLSEQFVRDAHEAGATMLVSLDCGSANVAEVKLAQDLGMKVLVIDHHDASPFNTADHHLNPSFINMSQAGEPYRSVLEARTLLGECEDARQASVMHPDDEQVAARLEECKARAADMIKRLDELSGTSTPSKKLQVAIEKASAAGEDDRLPNNNSAAQLNWKFAGALIEQAEGEFPQDWYGRALYVSSIGALADAMDMDSANAENRAFARVPVATSLTEDSPQVQELVPAHRDRITALLSDRARELYEAGDPDVVAMVEQDSVLSAFKEAHQIEIRESGVVPPLVLHVADALGEDITDPGSMIRTRAVLNTPKRTTRMDASLVGKGLHISDPDQLAATAQELMAEYENTVEVRDRMKAQGIEQWEQRKAQLRRKGIKSDPVVAAALLRGFEEDAGQARLVANELVKHEHVTAAVGVVRPDGLVKVSLSGIKKAEIGRVFDSHKLRSKLEEACVVEKTDEAGNTVKSISVGGHLRVVSGTCTQEKFPEVVKVFEEMGRDIIARDPKKWRQTVYKNKAMWVSERMVSPSRIRILERQAAQLAPTTNNNRGMDVSAAVRVHSLGDRDEKRGVTEATIEFADGMVRPATITDEALPAMRTGTFFEAQLSPARGQYYINVLAAIKEPKN